MFITRKISHFFQFDTFQTTFRKEIIGGVSTFLAMLYILSVQPQMLSSAPDVNHLNDASYNMSFGGIFISTAIAAFVATFIMGLSANTPVGLAPGMGLNAIFTFNVAKNGIGYQGALIAVMISSLIFCVISSTKLRTLIIGAIPHSIKLAIGSGIGFFIAYLGLHNIGLVGDNAVSKGGVIYNGGIPVAELGNLKTNWPVILMGLGVLILIFILHFKKIPGAIAIAIIVGLGVSLIVGNVVNNDFIKANFSHWTWWSYHDFDGFSNNIKSTFTAFGNSKIWTSPVLYVSIFVFLFVEFFDSTGTLYSVTKQISDQSGIKYELRPRSLIADSVGAIVGGVLGTSPVTTYVESTTGVSQGARTGFSSLVIGTLFLISIVLFPIFRLITPAIAGAATIFVGTLMIVQIKDIEWLQPELGIGAFFTIIMMIVTFSITNGIAVGFISYTIVGLINKKYRDIHIVTYILDILFIGYFIAYAFVQ
ncbi:NCS2 family permease [Spiroplasma eriocheiris]|uniref:Xanthine/uracil permease n=1 Tax=Spiroplasma eriocheiris TaxID=315358 RepID=A0A0H3XK60_9MOLU|nr:NCS2 family permease [Spiroplasma eriocheiris]AHF57266.1 putative xanthine/uracil permease [Spiroplasma eriocheiris CCTCC M 207170]AKM53729.1 xanthine/uracil permease [Spiroplasma eriocheiris]